MADFRSNFGPHPGHIGSQNRRLWLERRSWTSGRLERRRQTVSRRRLQNICDVFGTGSEMNHFWSLFWPILEPKIGQKRAPKWRKIDSTCASSMNGFQSDFECILGSIFKRPRSNVRCAVGGKAWERVGVEKSNNSLKNCAEIKLKVKCYVKADFRWILVDSGTSFGRQNPPQIRVGSHLGSQNGSKAVPSSS